MPIAVKLPPEAERAALEGERVMIELPGGRLAAIVPVEDLEALEALEEEADVRAYRGAKAEIEADGSDAVPLAEVKRTLGL
jgi:hypothetical protein